MSRYSLPSQNGRISFSTSGWTREIDSMYRCLNPEKILATIETLSRRIAERFPGSGLDRVCQELLTVAEESQRRSAWIAKPQRYLLFITVAGGTIVICFLFFVFG